jgi:hypothetical protein
VYSLDAYLERSIGGHSQRMKLAHELVELVSEQALIIGFGCRGVPMGL